VLQKEKMQLGFVGDARPFAAIRLMAQHRPIADFKRPCYLFGRYANEHQPQHLTLFARELYCTGTYSDLINGRQSNLHTYRNFTLRGHLTDAAKVAFVEHFAVFGHFAHQSCFIRTDWCTP
jgi:hypothetical protein